MSSDWKEIKNRQKRYPILSFIFVYEQASTSLQFAFQLVEKWEQLQQAQRKHLAIQKTLWPSILSQFFKENETKIYLYIYLECGGLVKQTIWESVVLLHLLSHSSLTTPHGTYINLWFMRSKFPLYLSVITVWLHFSLLGSDIQFNQQTLNSGTKQKVYKYIT